MLIIRNREALMIDTPTDNETTPKTSDCIRDSLGVIIVDFIWGYYPDSIGGMEYLNKTGVKAIMNQRTK